MFLLISFFFFLGLPVFVLFCIFVFILFVCWLFFSAGKGRNEYGGEPGTSLIPIKKRRQTKFLLQGNHEGIPSPR